jgi:hypothetical protein
VGEVGRVDGGRAGRHWLLPPAFDSQRAEDWARCRTLRTEDLNEIGLGSRPAILVPPDLDWLSISIPSRLRLTKRTSTPTTEKQIVQVGPPRSDILSPARRTSSGLSRRSS